MKKVFIPALAIFLMSTLSGCGLVEDAFKAGLIFAFVIVAIIAIIVWAVRFSADLISKKYKVETIPVRNKQATREV